MLNNTACRVVIEICWTAFKPILILELDWLWLISRHVNCIECFVRLFSYSSLRCFKMFVLVIVNCSSRSFLKILVPEYGMNYWVFFSVTFLNHGFWFPARLTKTGEKFCAKYSESFRLQVGYLLASYVQQEGIRCLQTFIGTTLLFPLR